MRSRHLFAFSLIVMSGLAFLAAVYAKEKSNGDYLVSPMVFSTSSTVGMDSSGFFNQSTRMQIYSMISESPGIHFREICGILGLSVGVVQYHLGLLVKRGFVKVRQDGRYKRYFQAEKYGEPEMRIISLLKHLTIRHILLALHANPHTHKELASTLGISSQALTWHMNRLTKTGFVEAVRDNSTVRYSLTSETDNLVRIGCLRLEGM